MAKKSKKLSSPVEPVITVGAPTEGVPQPVETTEVTPVEAPKQESIPEQKIEIIVPSETQRVDDLNSRRRRRLLMGLN